MIDKLNPAPPSVENFLIAKGLYEASIDDIVARSVEDGLCLNLSLVFISKALSMINNISEEKDDNWPLLMRWVDPIVDYYGWKKEKKDKKWTTNTTFLI